MSEALELEEVTARIQELRQRRSAFVNMANENEKMWKLKLFEKSAKEKLEQEGMEQITSSVPRNVINLAGRLMSSVQKIELPSIDSKADRDDRAEQIERWLTAYWERMCRQSKKQLINDQNWNILTLARGGYYVQYVRDALPKMVQQSHLPISVRVLDPRNMGVERNPYYTEYAYHAYTEQLLSVARRYPSLKERYKIQRSLDFRKDVEVCDFWYRDEEGEIWNCVLVDGEFVLDPEPTDYPDIPIIEVLGDSTPLSETEWESLSIIDPIRETWSYSSRLLSQVATALLNLFTPPLLAGSETATSIPDIELGPNAVTKLPKGVKLDALHIQPNAPLAQMMIGLVQGMVDQSTFPTVMYGDSGNMTAGYGVSILADQARGRISKFMANHEMGLEQVNALILALVDKVAGSQGVEVWGRNETDQKMYRTILKPSDIKGNYENMVSLQPQIPQDNVQRETLGLRMVDARIWSKRTFRDRIASMAAPSDEQQRIELEMAQEQPDVQARLAILALIEGYPEDWCWMVTGTPLEAMIPPKYVEKHIKYLRDEQDKRARLGQKYGLPPGQPMLPGNGMPPGAAPGQGGMPPGQQSPQMAPPAGAPPSPQEQLMAAIQSGELGPEQLIAMLQSGEITPDMLPPEVLQALEGLMQQQGAQQQQGPSPIDQLLAGIQNGQVGPQDVLALLESGQITPDMLPPELLAMLEQYMQQQQMGAQSEGMVPGMGAAAQGQLTPEAVGVTPQMPPGTFQAITGQPVGREEELDRIMGLPREMR